MPLANKQLTLPLLIAVSLTGVCAGLFYYFYKKDDDLPETVTTLKDRKQVTKEIRVPRELVPAVIGRGGSRIKEVEQRTFTRIRFADDDVTQTERVCIVRGALENVNLAEALINDTIANRPVIETYELMIPQKVREALLSDRGNLVHTIQNSTKAKISLDKGYGDPTGLRRVILRGTADQIGAALNHIEEMVRVANSTSEKLEEHQAERPPRGKALPSTPVENSVSTAGEEPSTPFESGTMKVYVSAAATPSQFWIQVVDESILKLDALVIEMTTYYEDERNRQLHALTSATAGQIVAAKFSFDTRWYRAEILSCPEPGRCEVFFLDYGDYEIVNSSDILELRTDFLSLRLLAIECCLAGVRPRDDEWSEASCLRFDALTAVAQWAVITAKIRGYKERVTSQGNRKEGSPIPLVDLFNKNDNQDINIGKQLVLENLAVQEDGAWSAASSTHSLPRSSSATPTPKSQVKPELIDLTTPGVSAQQPAVEVVDLVTPKRSRTEKTSRRERKSVQNPSATDEFPQSKSWRRHTNGVPGGEEAYDADSDEMEIF